MPFQTINNVSILPNNLTSREDPRHPIHYIHQTSASYHALCDVNPTLGNRIFRELMSNNTSTYTFNEADFESVRVVLVYHLTSNKHSGADIDDLDSKLVV